MRRVVVPFVAAIVVLAIAASPISAKTSRTRSRAGRKSMHRSELHEPASRVFPTEMNAASGIDAPLVAFATKAGERDGRPQAAPVEDEGGQRDAGRRPDRREPVATSSSIPILAATT